MKSPFQSRPNDSVISTTDVRQGSPKTGNLRVLAVSLALAAVVGAVLVGTFWFTTPSDVEGVPERAGVSQGETITVPTTAPTSTPTPTSPLVVPEQPPSSPSSDAPTATDPTTLPSPAPATPTQP